MARPVRDHYSKEAPCPITRTGHCPGGGLSSMPRSSRPASRSSPLRADTGGRPAEFKDTAKSAGEDHLAALLREKAPTSVRTDMTRFIGRSPQAPDHLEPEVVVRLTQLWDIRVQAVRDGSDPQELREFGEWLGAGRLGDEWEAGAA